MAYVSVPKDLTKVKNKVAFNLTKRQLICIGIGAAMGIPSYFLLRNVMGNSNAATVMVLLMLPAFLFAMYEKDGMHLEDVLMHMIRVKFLRPPVRKYETENYYETDPEQIRQSPDTGKPKGGKTVAKKKNKKTVADTGYKKVDRKEKKKKEKQEEKRRQKKLSVQQSIAYKEMGRDGICKVQGKTYSKCIRFYDINYQLAQNEDKNAIFENWCDFLNYFDASIHFQLSFINHKSSMKEFEQVIQIRPQEDAFDDVRMEYAKMLKQQLAKGNNGLVKSKYITFSIEADNIREAKPKLERIESDILNNFKILGVPAYPLNGVERLQILYETFNPDNMTDFQFDYGSMIRTGLNTKDYVAPTSFVFRDRNTFQMGNTIGAVSYLQILAPELTDKMLAEFLDIDKNLIVNLHVQSVDQMKAIKLVKSKVTDINRMKIEEQKKAVRAGYDMGATRSLITA